jgi:hypothetical protein
LNRQIAASVTGGDGFPCLTFASLLVAGPNSAILTLLNQGEHPLYEVNGYIADLQESRQVSDKEQVPAWTWFKNIQGGNMSPNSARPLFDWQLPETDEQDYNVFLNARNGFFTQLVRLRRVDGSWRVATRVRKQFANGDESPTLFLDVDAGFPLNERGEVDWS